MSDTPPEEDGDWQFNLDEVTEGGQVEYEPEPIEPGSPTLEGAFFVLLGVALTVFVLVGI